MQQNGHFEAATRPLRQACAVIATVSLVSCAAELGSEEQDSESPAPSPGGSPAAGGAPQPDPATGGVPGDAGGGSAPAGGGSSSGGVLTHAGGTGGSWAAGGTDATGGANATGGTPMAGGASSGGGPSATGGNDGVDASGGADATGGPEPMGQGWEEYFPDWDYHLPPGEGDYGERYTYEDGVWHLWVESSDTSTFPGQDSGPRSEVRVRNEYNSGQRQFQADFMVIEGAERVGIWQLFKRPYPWMIRIYDGQYRQFGNGSSFGDVPFGVWQRFYSIHDANTNRLEIYIDGERVVDEDIGESEIDFYNKFGVYGRDGMGELNEIYFKNVHFFRKD